MKIQFPTAAGTQIVRAGNIQVELPSRPVRYYRHGWQSWSLAAWTNLDPLPVPKPAILHALQVDAEHVHDRLPNGSWLGAVEFEDGSVFLLGALGLDAHVRLEGKTLCGSYDAGEIEWLAAYGSEEAVFGEYARRLGERLGIPPGKPAPRVWCSWYSLYTAIDEQILGSIIDGLTGLPFDVIQVDDGWQAAIGDWQANPKFPSGMAALAAKIKSTGRKAGLWLAPLIAVRSSQLFREHPNWFLRRENGELVSAGVNWGESLVALDTTHPEASTWLTGLMRQVREWGFDYLKLDFLYAGALKGKRYQNLPREQAYRQALSAMRSAMGEDAFFLTCGTPILPALGLCDAMRTGPDVGGDWQVYRDAALFSNPATPSAVNALRTVLSRLWLRPLVHMDPDVVYFTEQGNRLTSGQKQALQDLAHITGFRATSDLPQWMTVKEREHIQQFLTQHPGVVQESRGCFSIDRRQADYSRMVDLPPAPTGLTALWAGFLGWLASQPPVLKLRHQAWERSTRRLRESLD